MDPDLHKALRLKAVGTSRSVSDLVNDAVREALAEDAEDIGAFEERAREPLISYDEMRERPSEMGAMAIRGKKALWPVHPGLHGHVQPRPSSRNNWA